MKFKSYWLAALTLAYVHGASADTAQVIPTTYEAGHFYAVPETRDGQRLKLLVDTGGQGGSGLYVLNAATIKRLQLRASSCHLGHESIDVAQLPKYRPGHGLPPPVGPCGQVISVALTSAADGVLGAGYLPSHIWTFDYPSQTLSIKNNRWRPDPSAHASALGFMLNASGQLGAGLPRIVIRVDNQPLDMLLDTGASAHPTAAGAKATGMPTVNGMGVTSYITASMLEQWHKAHLDWPVVDKGDDLLRHGQATRMIQVPQVQIAGWSVGPIWFTERSDNNFHGDGLSSYMDKQVEGSVGGNVFQHFVMTLDYPHRTAYFRCASGCRAIPPPAP